MAKTIPYLVAVAVVLGTSLGALAQVNGGVGPATTGQARPCSSGVTSFPCGRGPAASGTGVRTGQGPLTKPIPPAVSTMNPPHNPQLPQNMRGPVHTNPPQEPFGSR